MRTDAKRNYEHLLEVARELFKRDTENVSLRDVARRAGVGDATLHRHFPTREAILEALLREGFEQLAQRARELQSSDDPAESLKSWIREAIAVTRDYRGAIASMVAAIEDESSALHAACVSLRRAGTALLARAQEEGRARADMDGNDLFALVSALAWLADQPPLVPRSERLLEIILSAVLTS